MSQLIFQFTSGQNMTKKDKENYQNMYGLPQTDKDNLLTNFLNAHLPGFKTTDPLTKISAMLSSRNPNAVIGIDILMKAKLPCVNVTSKETNCPEGFVLAPKTGK
jgi:hypothetical protein